jgi:hypothetical protein
MWRQPRKVYAIEGNSSIYNQEEDYIVLIEFYKPLEPAARHPEFSNLFFVKDSPIQDIGEAALGKFTRTWAVLPGYGDKGYVRNEYESFAFQVPALDTAQDLFYQFPRSADAIVNGKLVITVTTFGSDPPWNALDVELNKPATIFYLVRDPLNGLTQQRQIVRKTLAVTTNTITVDPISDIGSITITGVQRADIQQVGYTKQVMSRLDIDYWIPGVNCNSIDDVPIISELQIIDNKTGGRTTTISDDTTPSLDQWFEWVQDSTWLVAEPSVVRRWQGNFFERTTRYVRAQI